MQPDEKNSERADLILGELLKKKTPEVSDKRALKLLHSMLSTCFSLVEEDTAVVDLKLVDAALSEIHDAFTCFGPYQAFRKVTTFGSARIAPGRKRYEMARRFSEQIADAGYMVITGGGPGIMQACQEGAGRERSFGVNIRLPFEQEANEFIRNDSKLVDFKYFFTRKLFFLKESSAVVMFPGGFGTLDECFETLTLIQTGKAQLMPVVFVDVPGGRYWKQWNNYVQTELMNRGLISDDDRHLYLTTDNIDEAVHEITEFYSVFHSARSIRNRLVLRLNRPVPESLLNELSEEFADILDEKPITAGTPFPEESDEPELRELPRLLLNFDMKSHGRLRQLINAINRRS